MKIKAYIFVLLYLIALLKPIAPLINYAFNKDYIIKTFCENKDKPELKCNGKCHLAKQLKKNNDKNKELPKINKNEYPIGFICLFGNILVYSKKIKQNFFYYIRFYKTFINTIEQPPDYYV